MIDSLSARKLDDSEGASLPFWSPDSRRIGFFTRSKLKIIAAAGGRAETIADAPGGRGATWNESNVIVFAPDAGGPLYRVPATGGTPEPVTSLEANEYGHRMPAFLPDGQHFLYAVLPSKNGKFDIFAGSLASQQRAFIGSLEAAPVYADSGSLLYARQGILTALPFDPRALRIAGDPVTLEDEPASILDPATSFTAGRSVSVSRTGSLAYYSAPSLNTVATWYDASGAQVGTLNVPAGHYETISIAPDGARGVLVRSTSPSESSLWLIDMARGGATPLSSGPGRNDNPVWSPDGTRVVWASDRDGTQKFFVKDVNEGGPEQMLFGSNTPFKNPSAWSPDAQWMTFTQLDPGTAQNIYLMDPSGTKDPKVFVQGSAREIGGPLSPDGHWMAYVVGRERPVPALRASVSRARTQHTGLRQWGRPRLVVARWTTTLLCRRQLSQHMACGCPDGRDIRGRDAQANRHPAAGDRLGRCHARSPALHRHRPRTYRYRFDHSRAELAGGADGRALGLGREDLGCHTRGHIGLWTPALP